MTPIYFTLRDFSLRENRLADYPSLLSQEHNIRLAVRLLADAHPNPTSSDFAKLYIIFNSDGGFQVGRNSVEVGRN